ncbi:hypothetical protein CH333_08675 [candidate division WOR-3 bacterium JGI_Cruoil_03_44_89]|uniref:Glutamate--cysteine ligase n=1 Tax=candidate division WOR-3 bacterium JGI_Cruoil_03_44_89 TaxID=1973748 RepID=A0A235BPR3_UNCW3|nr:MAG: hypothetical protein CH333_08675 [candidate division WOR-3 bacterium JGI_Cruoil_03_44_89]
MGMFKPVTFGYEWETLVLKPDLSLTENRDVEWLARRIRNKFPWSRTGTDYLGWGREGRLLEIRSGILESYTQLVEETHHQLDEIRKVCRDKGWVFLPIGSHPVIGNAVGLHVHTGSIYDFPVATGIADVLIKYAPCFAALASNSPIWGRNLKREFKSYRVMRYADYDSTVRRITRPDVAQFVWGDDVCVKTDIHSTIELRIGDSASSEEFVNQYVAFVIAFVVGFLKKNTQRFSKNLYLEYIENRFRAARYGLQARFAWDGEERDVVDILWDMMDTAEFKAIGCSGLGLIEEMLRKHQTQADFCLFIHKFRDDVFELTRELGNLSERGNAFYDYLSDAPKLPSLEPLKIDDFILSSITKETPISYIYELLNLPYGVLTERLEKFIERGKIVRERTPEYGERYTRTDV